MNLLKVSVSPNQHFPLKMFWPKMSLCSTYKWCIHADTQRGLAALCSAWIFSSLAFLGEFLLCFGTNGIIPIFARVSYLFPSSSLIAGPSEIPLVEVWKGAAVQANTASLLELGKLLCPGQKTIF